MMVTKGGSRDTVTGAVVVAVAAVLLGLVYLKDTRKSEAAGYLIEARFNRLDGVSVGTPVRLSGVKIGTVAEQALAPDFRAVTHLRINDEVELPADSSAAIRTDGLLGAKYIEIGPGGDDTMLKNGDSIVYTQDSMVIEELIELIIEQGKGKRGYAGRPVPSVVNN